jgi:hypothetical protein
MLATGAVVSTFAGAGISSTTPLCAASVIETCPPPTVYVAPLRTSMSDVPSAKCAATGMLAVLEAVPLLSATTALLAPLTRARRRICCRPSSWAWCRP